MQQRRTVTIVSCWRVVLCDILGMMFATQRGTGDVSGIVGTMFMSKTSSFPLNLLQTLSVTVTDL